MILSNLPWKTETKKIVGTLKESGLSIKRSDLSRIYGTDMPGKWFVVGIVDSVALEETLKVKPSDFDDMIDLCSATFRKLYSQAAYTIVPILIYRMVQFNSLNQGN